MAYNFGQGYSPVQAPQSGFGYPPSNFMPQVQSVTQGQQAAPQQGFRVQPVASKEEAMAVQTDFFGPGVLMPCLGQRAIFLKRFDPNTGLSDFLEFMYVQPQPPRQEPEGGYVPMDLFRQLVDKVAQLEKGVTASVPE